MLPLILDIKDLPIALIGRGTQATNRLKMLDAAGAGIVRVYAPDATKELAELAGTRLQLDLPQPTEITARLLYIADFTAEETAPYVAHARAHNIWVNVEDQKEYCDFHVPASLRRGDLLFTISTNGTSPALARRLRAHLETIFPAEWGARAQELANQRDQWRKQGASINELARLSNDFIDEKGWLV